MFPTELSYFVIGRGDYSDKYFVRTRDILLAENRHSNVLMQVFGRREGIVCGIDEAIDVLRCCCLNDSGKQLAIKALRDGDSIENKEVVMTIEGDFSTFAHLETVYLGILARSTSVATNVKEVVDAACGLPVMFFPARFDHWRIQQGDGYAAHIAGAASASTDANAEWYGGEGMGTIPHALIASYGGNTVEACKAFDRNMPKEIKRIALVDFENNCVKTSLEVAVALDKRLYAVRLDTSGNMVDVSVKSGETGVCQELVCNVRKALDDNKFPWVKIIVSGGFNVEKVTEFLNAKVPVDGFGVGSTFYKKKTDFTADIVLLDGNSCAKVGRGIWDHSRLELVET